MSKKKTFLIAGSLIGGTVLLVGALGGAHAFGGRHGGWSDSGWNRDGGHEWGGRGGPRMMRHFGRGGPRGDKLRRADANNDGVITKEEATAKRQKRFDRFDLDKNGEVTTNEAINAVIKRFESRIKRKIRSYDENGDGKVSKEEFNAPVLERFAERDTNKDGKLTKDEMSWFGDRRGGRRGGWFERYRGPQGGPGMFRPQKQGPGMGGQQGPGNMNKAQ